MRSRLGSGRFRGKTGQHPRLDRVGCGVRSLRTDVKKRQKQTAHPPTQGQTSPRGEASHALGMLDGVSIGLTFLVALLISIFPARSDDIYGYLAFGKQIVERHALPTSDPFLFSIPESPPHAHHEWASFVAAYLLHRVGGFDLLIVLKAVGVLLWSVGAWFLSWRVGYRSPLVAGVILLGLWTGCDRFLERCSLVSDVLTAVVAIVLCLERRAPTRWLWAIPVIFAVWVNVHPGYVVGAALVVFALLATALRRPGVDVRASPSARARESADPVRPSRDAALRRLGLCAVSSALACLLNPRFFEGAIFPLRFAFSPDAAVYRQYYFEFQPPLGPYYVGWWQTWLFVALSVVTTGLGLATLRRDRSAAVFGLLASALLIGLGLSAVRFTTTAALTLPILAIDFAASLELLAINRTRRGRYALAASAAVGIVAFALCVKLFAFGYTPASGPRHVGLGIDEGNIPVHGAEFLERVGFNGRLFNQHEYGGYLAWRWGPVQRLFWHGMAADMAFYAEDYIGVSRSAVDFERVVDKYGLTAFLLPHWDASPTRGPPILLLLLNDPDWHLVFWDDTCALWLRDVAENREAIDRHEYRLFDPFRLDRFEAALQNEPQRAFTETVRVLRESPKCKTARHVLRTTFKVDPDEVLARERRRATSSQ